LLTGFASGTSGTNTSLRGLCSLREWNNRPCSPTFASGFCRFRRRVQPFAQYVRFGTLDSELRSLQLTRCREGPSPNSGGRAAMCESASDWLRKLGIRPVRRLNFIAPPSESPPLESLNSKNRTHGACHAFRCVKQFPFPAERSHICGIKGGRLSGTHRQRLVI
jgi:hypothetical protein